MPNNTHTALMLKLFFSIVGSISHTLVVGLDKKNKNNLNAQKEYPKRMKSKFI